MDTFLKILEFAPVLLVPFGLLLAWLGTKAVKAVEETKADQKTNGALSRLLNLTFLFTRDVNDTYKQEIIAAKDPSSAGGTKITKEEAAALNKEVWKRLGDAYGKSAFDKIKHVIGVGSEDAVKSIVNAQIEQAVDQIEGRDSKKVLDAVK